MKSEKKILIAFILNTLFSAFELFGGFCTGSTAIISDALHDAGDALSIGISFLLEKKSRKQPDDSYTYGYIRYSVAGSIISSVVLLIGSAAMIYNAIHKIINPSQINSNGMIVFAIIGVAVNSAAVFLTHKGDSLNSKTVNLHMLEDVLGWIAVLIGSVMIKLTGFTLLDPIISICVSFFICISTLRNLKVISDIFLEKIPEGISISEIRSHIRKIEGIIDVHHIHIRSIDGYNNYATMHIVTNANPKTIKERIRKTLKEHRVCHTTIEIESENEQCEDIHCHINTESNTSHHHHH